MKKLTCLELLKTTTRPPKKNIYRSFTSFLSKYKTEVRYGILKLFSPRSKRPTSYAVKYAKFLNDALEGHVITKKRVNEIIDELRSSGYPHIFMHTDGRIYANTSYQILKSKKKNSLKSLMDKYSFLVEQDRIFFKEEIDQLDITEKEYPIIIENLKKARTLEDVEDQIFYLKYLRGQKFADYDEALEEMGSLFGNMESKHLSTFDRYKKNITKAKLKQKKKIEKKVRSSNKGRSEKEIQEEIKIKSKSYNQTYKKLYYSCKAKTQNIDRLAANKLLLRSMLGFEIVSSVSSFAFAHRNDERDETYWKKLAFDLGVSLPWVAMRSSVASAPTISMKSGIITDYLLGSAMDTFPTLVVYQKQFGVNDDDIKARLEEILKSDNFQSHLTKILTTMDKDGVVEEQQALLSELGISDVKSAFREGGDPSKMEQLLRERIAREIYLERRGAWPFPDTGSVGMDIFVYNKLWGTQSSVRNIALAYWMYHILCTGQKDPRKALMLTFALYSGNKVINSFGYQYLRKGFTGQ